MKCNITSVSDIDVRRECCAASSCYVSIHREPSSEDALSRVHDSFSRPQ